MISYEEFEALVVKKLPKYINNISEKEVLEYVKTEDAQDAIKGNYESGVAKVKAGKMSEDILKGDTVSGTAYCLMMLY